MDRHSEAATHYASWLHENPDDIETWVAQGEAQAAVAEFALAAESFRRACECEPDDMSLQKKLAKVQLQVLRMPT